ncbi:tetratricopeptide repeat protein [Serratia marcescens]|uniref:tetratricopeptide repeat protein n=3 Tax=Serratia marcescens TaxID=615 RepID=UPI0018D6B189|nr:hypothetical protein [Serratia marcescens]MBH3126136.1 hypothetical protein [Serratia marcescens]
MMADSNSTMDWVKLIIEIIKWPATLVIIALIFRTSVKEFANKIKTFKLNNGNSSIEATISEPPNEAAQQPVSIDRIENMPPKLEEVKQEEKPQNENVNWIINTQNEINEGNIENARALFLKHIENINDEDKKHYDKSFLLFCIYEKTNQQEILLELERHTRNAPSDEALVKSTTWYTMALDKTKNYKASLAFLQEILIKIKTPKDITNLISKIAEVHLSNSEPNEARELVISRLQEKLSDEENFTLYKTLSEIELKLDNKRASALCLDKALEYSPNDKDIMFKSAYEASNVDLKPIEISNYDTLLNLDEKQDHVLNNFGVSALNEGLNTIAVNYYEKAADLGNTLSMANLGSKLLTAGFSGQANILSQKAISLKNPHENIYSLLKQIKKTSDDEKKKWDEIKEKSFELQKRIRIYTASYYYKNDGVITSGKWNTNNNHIAHIELLEKQTIKISIESGIDGATINIVGTFYNHSFNCVYTETNPKNTTSLLSSDKNKTIKCLGYLDETGSKITIFAESIANDFEMILLRDNQES